MKFGYCKLDRVNLRDEGYNVRFEEIRLVSCCF